MTIKIIHAKPFEGIDTINFSKYEKENPLLNHPLPRDIFTDGKWEDYNPVIHDIAHWEVILGNHISSIVTNFTYSMYYFYKGIPDDEWIIIPEDGGSVEYFPHFEDEHYRNLMNFCHFIDVFFLKVFSTFEAIGHLLYKYFQLELNEHDWRDQISFRSAIYKLEEGNYPLYKDLRKIIKSPKFTRGVKIRNQITHSQPPYSFSSGVSIINGEALYSIPEYTCSKDIKNAMINILQSLRNTLEILERHIKRR